MSQTKFRVQDARKRDIGRNMTRIDENIMKKLNIQAGDVVEIIGKKHSASIAWPGYPEDYGKDIIRISPRLRKNTGTKVDDKVEIKKAEAKNARKIILTPIDDSFKNNPKLESFVKNKIIGYPITLNDFISVSTGLKKEVEFQVTELQPEGVCIVHNEAVVKIKRYQ